MELVAGCRGNAQLADLRQLLDQFTLLPITPEITARARDLMETYTLSHGALPPDALIAATAIEAGLAPYTRNIRHFRMIPELLVIQPY